MTTLDPDHAANARLQSELPARRNDILIHNGLSVLNLRFAAMAMTAGSVFLVAAGSAALADMSVCNQTLDVINIAVAEDGDRATPDGFVSKGWWSIGPNQCAKVIHHPLDPSKRVYIHAEDALGQVMVSGDKQLCTRAVKFDIEGGQDCWSRGLITAGFQRVDTGDAVNWTLFIPGDG